MTKKIFTLVVLLSGVCLGYFGKEYISLNKVFAQSSVVSQEKIFVKGHGVANTSLHPSETKVFQFVPQEQPQTSFTVVPKGKKLIITDFVFHPYNTVIENMTVNVAINGDIMYQMRIQPNKSESLNFCSGYIATSGKQINAWTDANAKDGQVTGVSITGYLIDE